MKKILLSLLTLFAVTMAATASEVTITQDGSFTWTAGSDATYGAGFSATTGGFNLGLWKNTSTSTILEPASEIRVYKNAAFVIENVDGAAITKVVMTTTAKDKTCNMTANGVADAAVGDGNAKTVTWTGNANQLVLVANVGQVRVKSMVITYGEAEPVTKVEKPTVKPASGTYYEPVEFTCSTATEGATLKYSLDGGETYADYSGPVEIAASCEIEVYAVKEGLDDSEHVSAVYTITEPEAVASVAEANAKAESNAVVRFSNPVTCIYQNGSYTYVKDETGYTLIYGNGLPTYTNGSVVPAGFYGKMTIYNDLIEFTTQISKDIDTKTSFAESTESVTPIEPTVVAVGDVTAAMMNQYVKLVNATYNATDKKLVDGDNALAVYNRFNGVKLPEDGNYTVSGFVSIYKGAIQIFPTEFELIGSVDGINAAEAQDNAPVYNLLGQPVSRDTKGQVLVKNGKKFINK